MQSASILTPSHLHPYAMQSPPAPAREKKLNILLVEDTNSDALLTRIAIEETHVPCHISRVAHGDLVLSGLLARQRLCPSEMPDLILLDLGLPGMDGFEILAELSQLSPMIRAIPIIILTAYENFEYISTNYPLCVLAYLSKPCSVEDVRAALAQVGHYPTLLH